MRLESLDHLLRNSGLFLLTLRLQQRIHVRVDFGCESICKQADSGAEQRRVRVLEGRRQKMRGPRVGQELGNDARLDDDLVLQDTVRVFDAGYEASLQAVCELRDM